MGSREDNFFRLLKRSPLAKSLYLYLGVYKMYLGVYKDVTSLVSDSAYNLKTYPDPGFFLTLPEMLSNFF